VYALVPETISGDKSPEMIENGDGVRGHLAIRCAGRRERLESAAWHIGTRETV